MEDAKFETILMRIASVTKSIKPKDLAPILGISEAAVSKSLGKKKIPQNWLYTLITKYNLTLDWLMYGNGKVDQEKTQYTGVEGVLTKIGQKALMDIYDKLVESKDHEIELLKERNKELKEENAILKASLSASRTQKNTANSA